jgi:hypothetical protein
VKDNGYDIVLGKQFKTKGMFDCPGITPCTDLKCVQIICNDEFVWCRGLWSP